MARNDESEDIEEEDIEWHSTITLSKEGVVGTGIFENESYYSVEETDSGTLLLINVSELSIGVNATSGAYRLSSRGHVGYNYNNNAWVKATNTKQTEDVKQALLKSNNLSSFEVYPNPTNDRINVDLVTIKDEKVIIEIFNYKGQLVKTVYAGQTKANEKIVISNNILKEVPQGIYQMRCTVGDKSFVRPISLN